MEQTQLDAFKQIAFWNAEAQQFVTHPDVAKFMQAIEREQSGLTKIELEQLKDDLAKGTKTIQRAIYSFKSLLSNQKFDHIEVKNEKQQGVRNFNKGALETGVYFTALGIEMRTAVIAPISPATVVTDAQLANTDFNPLHTVPTLLNGSISRFESKGSKIEKDLALKLFDTRGQTDVKQSYYPCIVPKVIIGNHKIDFETEFDKIINIPANTWIEVIFHGLEARNK